jgi:hypothetical protein
VAVSEWGIDLPIVSGVMSLKKFGSSVEGQSDPFGLDFVASRKIDFVIFLHAKACVWPELALSKNEISGVHL